MLVVKEEPAQSISHLVVFWLAMVPTFFFACRGILWFQASGGNSSAGTGFGSLTVAKGGGEVEVLGSVFLCVALLLMTRLASVARLCWSNKLFIALALYALASCLWSQFPRLTLQFGIYIVLDVLFVFYLCSRFRPNALMQFFVCLGWMIVLSSIVFAIVFPRYGVDHRASTAGAWQGIFVFKNTCAIMVTFLLSAAFYLPVTSVRSRLLRAGLVALTVFLVLMTRARTGWIVMAALLVYVAVTQLISSFAIRERLAVAVLLCTAMLIVFVSGGLLYQDILHFLGKDATLTGRTGIWKLALASAMKRPLLGYGYRAFWNGLHGESANITLMEQWTVPGAHNGLLEVWLDLGLVGLAAVVFTALRALRDGATCLRYSATPRVRWYLSIVVLTIVSNVAEMTIMYPNYLTWIMYVMACVGLAGEANQIRRGEVAS